MKMIIYFKEPMPPLPVNTKDSIVIDVQGDYKIQISKIMVEGLYYQTDSMVYYFPASMIKYISI